MAQYSCLENPMDGGAWWAAVHGVAKSWTRLSEFTFTFHFHALEKEMATHSSVLAWRISGMGEPGGLPSMGSHRVGHDWSDLALAWWLRWYRICLQCWRPGLDPRVGKITWRWWSSSSSSGASSSLELPTPVFWPGECHGQRSLASYNPWALLTISCHCYKTIVFSRNNRYSYLRFCFS